MSGFVRRSRLVKHRLWVFIRMQKSGIAGFRAIAEEVFIQHVSTELFPEFAGSKIAQKRKGNLQFCNVLLFGNTNDSDYYHQGNNPALITTSGDCGDGY